MPNREKSGKPLTRPIIFAVCLLLMLFIGTMRTLGFSFIPNWGNIAVYISFIALAVISIITARAIGTTLVRRLALTAVILLLSVGVLHALFHTARHLLVAEEEITRADSPKGDLYAIGLRIDAGATAAHALRVEARREWGGFLRWSKILLIRDRTDDCRLAWYKDGLLVVEYYGAEDGVALLKVK